MFQRRNRSGHPRAFGWQGCSIAAVLLVGSFLGRPALAYTVAYGNGDSWGDGTMMGFTMFDVHISGNRSGHLGPVGEQYATGSGTEDVYVNHSSVSSSLDTNIPTLRWDSWSSTDDTITAALNPGASSIQIRIHPYMSYSMSQGGGVELGLTAHGLSTLGTVVDNTVTATQGDLVFNLTDGESTIVAFHAGTWESNTVMGPMGHMFAQINCGYTISIVGDGIITTESGASLFLPGDANCDGRVDDNDLGLLLGNWSGETFTNPGWGKGDFNADGRADDNDLGILLGHWTGSDGAAVPEPITLGLLASGGLFMFRRPRRLPVLQLPG